MPPTFTPVQETGETDTAAPSLRVISYNILAQSYVKSSVFTHSPKESLRWKSRSKKVLGELLSFEADLLCLQELDEFDGYYRPSMERSGYASLYRQRPGKKKDGCGIFFKTSKLDLIAGKDIDYNDLVPLVEMKRIQALGDVYEARDVVRDPWVRLKRDCVGIMGAFAWKGSTDVAFIAACTHLYWDPNLADVKLAQARHLMASLTDFQRQLGAMSARKIPVIVGGDFNSQPGDKVHQFLSGEEETSEDSGRNPESKEGTSSPPPPVETDSEESTMRKMYSAYAMSRGAEPPFTNYTPGFTGTLDYIWIWPPSRVSIDSLLDLPGPEAESIQGGLPNKSHASDHLPLGADLRIHV